jgi:hypothetical protein
MKYRKLLLKYKERNLDRGSCLYSKIPKECLQVTKYRGNKHASVGKLSHIVVQLAS